MVRATEGLGRWFLAAAVLGLFGCSDEGRSGRPSFALYVEGNDPAGNSIHAWHIGSSGALSAVTGSPFSTGGLGTPTMPPDLFDSDQNLLVDSTARRLYAVDGGSDRISGFAILPDGALRPLPWQSFDSGGAVPVSIGLAGRWLVAVNKGVSSVLPSYAVFDADSAGPPRGPISTVELDPGASPTQAAVGRGGVVLGADFLSMRLQAFQVSRSGQLVQGPNTPQPLPPAEFGPDQRRRPLGLAVHPHQPTYYVGFVNAAKMGVYTYDGSLIRFERTVANSGAAICWIVVSPDGRCAYTANTGDNSVSAYDLTDPLRPVEVQRLVLQGPGLPFQIGVEPGNRFVHVVKQPIGPDPGSTGSISTLRREQGSCRSTESPDSPLSLSGAAGVRPQGIAYATLGPVL